MKNENAKIEVEINGVALPIKLQFQEHISMIRSVYCHMNVHYVGNQQFTFVTPEFFSLTFTQKAENLLDTQSVFELIKKNKIKKVRVINDIQDYIYCLTVPENSATEEKIEIGEWGDGGMIYTFSWR